MRGGERDSAYPCRVDEAARAVCAGEAGERQGCCDGSVRIRGGARGVRGCSRGTAGDGAKVWGVGDGGGDVEKRGKDLQGWGRCGMMKKNTRIKTKMGEAPQCCLHSIFIKKHLFVSKDDCV